MKSGVETAARVNRNSAAESHTCAPHETASVARPGRACPVEHAKEPPPRRPRRTNSRAHGT
eukprot:scaffold2587_cov41-Phaeocystis_antarctica.AAC.2